MTERQPHKFWTTTELQFMRDNPKMTDKQFAVKFDRKPTAASTARKRHGIFKPKEQGQFKRGQKPFNTGMFGQTWISPDKIDKVRSTQFKKGNVCKTARTMFEIFTGKCGYLFIKIPGNRGMALSRYNWQNATGQILSNLEIISFIDGNKLNCEFSNLKKLTRTENLKRNENREKASLSLRKAWSRYKLYKDYGAESKYKFDRKRAGKDITNPLT